tara:strand:+ start:139 stop:534 length:396 start_codon:yes stop_codon:yes gene_type:complete
VDTNTVSVHDGGTNVDIFAVPTDALVSIGARNGAIELLFEDTGKLNPQLADGDDDGDITSLERTRVDIDCSNANIPTVMQKLIRAINRAPHGDGLLVFDEVNSVYPGDITASECTAIVILRTTTAQTVAVA